MLRPIELGNFAGYGPDVLTFPDFGRPLKEVGFDDAFQPGIAVQGSAIEQGGRVGLGLVDDVDAEVGLQDKGDQGGQVSVADIKPIGGFRVAGGVLAQGDLQQFLPEFPLDGHGGIIPVVVVGVFEQSGGLFQQVAVNAQVLGQGSGGGDDIFGGGVDDVVKIFPQPGALSRPVKDLHGVGGKGQDVVADIALEVVAAVGKDAVLDAPAGFDGIQQVAVQLAGIAGVDAAADYDIPLELDVGVADAEVDAPNAVAARRNFGIAFAFVGDNAGTQDKVPESQADIFLRLAVVMAFQQFVEVLGSDFVVLVEGGLEGSLHTVILPRGLIY